MDIHVTVDAERLAALGAAKPHDPLGGGVEEAEAAVAVVQLAVLTGFELRVGGHGEEVVVRPRDVRGGHLCVGVEVAGNKGR